MNNKNKRMTAGTLILCTLTSTGLLNNLQTTAIDSEKVKKAAKECEGDILKTGAAVVGGGIIVDKIISDKIPNSAKEFFSELGRFATKPIKWVGRNVINIISEIPPLLLIGGIVMVGYSIKKIAEKYFDNSVKEEAKRAANNTGSNDVTININNNDVKEK